MCMCVCVSSKATLTISCLCRSAPHALCACIQLPGSLYFMPGHECTTISFHSSLSTLWPQALHPLFTLLDFFPMLTTSVPEMVSDADH